METIYGLDESHQSLDAISEHDEHEDKIDTNSVEAWRTHFLNKKIEREEKQQYPKAPLWIFKPEKKKVQLKIPNEVEKVRDIFFKARSLFWDEIRENVYFIDEVNKTFIRYTPALDELKLAKMEVDGSPAFVIPIIDNVYEYVVGIGHDIYKMEWNGKSKKVSYLQLLKEQSALNDTISSGRADPIGRLLLVSNGTAGDDSDGSVNTESPSNRYRAYLKAYETPNKFTSVIELPVEKCTGLAWNWQVTRIYVITSSKDIQVYAYKIQQGKLGEKVDVIPWKKLARVKGYPQCITCDQFNNLWIGCSKTAQIVQINPSSKLVLRLISLDRRVLEVTSLVFGHTNRDVLYATTVNSKEESPDLERDYTRRNMEQASAGLSSLIRIWNVGSRALADYRVRVFK